MQFIDSNKITPKEVRLTREDVRNGWTRESLAEYLNDRNKQKNDFAKNEKQIRNVKSETTKIFNPQDW